MLGNVKYRSSWRPKGQRDSHSIDKKSSHTLKMFCSLRQELQTLEEYLVHKLLAVAQNKDIFLFSYGSTLLTDNNIPLKIFCWRGSGVRRTTVKY